MGTFVINVEKVRSVDVKRRKDVKIFWNIIISKYEKKCRLFK